jgi:hypothetical protein
MMILETTGGQAKPRMYCAIADKSGILRSLLVTSDSSVAVRQVLIYYFACRIVPSVISVPRELI